MLTNLGAQKMTSNCNYSSPKVNLLKNYQLFLNETQEASSQDYVN